MPGLTVHQRLQSELGLYSKEYAFVFRFAFLAIIFSAELTAIPVILGKEGLAQQISSSGRLILHASLGFAACFATFAWLKYRAVLGSISGELSSAKINRWALAAHFCSIAAFTLLFSSWAEGVLSPSPTIPFAAIRLIAGMVAIGSGAVSMIPVAIWLRLLRETDFLWAWALAAASVFAFVYAALPVLWPMATDLTFLMLRAVLSPFVSHLVTDPSKLLIGTQRFQVEISPACSGLEGIGLILAFGLAWLGLFREECRFPQALLLLPAGVLLIFGLNTVRIAALILIGDAGAEQIAVRGFHSQAGWIVFNLVALGFSVSARRVSWLSKERPSVAEVRAQIENPTVRWLLPFVAILAAGMLASAFTADFEWLYPLRFIAATVTFVLLWRRYRDLNWRVTWVAPVAGLVVFLIWIGLDRTAPAASEAMPAALSAASPLARFLWLIVRVLSAVITVPLAEELAFRGFLYRRLVSSDFESVSFQRFSWVALICSSVAFGLLHGDRWFVGSLAGGIYALVLLRRGSLGDAVVAHGVTNAFLAIDVLAFRHWHLW